MATGDTFVNLALKRFLSQNRMSNDFLEYNQEGRFDVLSRIFPEAGLFTYPVGIVVVPGSFTLGPDPIEGCDNAGHTLVITGADRLVNIPFENIALDVYWIGFKYIEIPQGVYVNPRTGQYEYDLNVEEVGETDDPSAVVDLVGTIRFNCNSIFEAGVDHSGRTVRVWLKNPMSGDEAVAFEDLTVVYDAGTGENRVTSAGQFGQTTVSINTVDYSIACLGCTIRKSVLNPYGPEYLDIGNITGDAVAPTTNTTGIQLDLSGGGGHSLQAAYDGAAGSGSGRNILADDLAVNITQENDSVYEHDIFHANLRITCDADKALYSAPPSIADFEVGIDLKSRFFSWGGYIHRVNIGDYSGSGYLNNSEDITVAVAGDQITFNGAGVDLTFPALNMALHPDALWEVCEIYNSTAGNDGVYFVSTITANTMDLLNLDGTAAVLAQEIANPLLSCSIYRLASRTGFVMGGTTLISTCDIQRDVGTGQDLLQLIVPSGVADTESILSVERYNAAGAAVTDYLHVFADGDLETTKDVSADGNINAGGEFRSTIAAGSDGLHIVSGDAYVGGDGEIGNDFEIGNDLTVNNDISVVGGGAIESLDAGGSLTVHSNITSTTGNIITALGDVASGANVFATVDVKATADFRFSTVPTFRTRFGAEDMISEWDGTTGAPVWVPNDGGVTPPLLRMQAIAHTTVGMRCYLPLKFPDNCELHAVSALVDSAVAGITMGIIKVPHDYVTPGVGAAVSLGTATAATNALEVLSVTAIGETIDNDSNRYFVYFDSSATAGGDIIYDANVAIKVDEFRPHIG